MRCLKERYEQKSPNLEGFPGLLFNTWGVLNTDRFFWRTLFSSSRLGPPRVSRYAVRPNPKKPARGAPRVDKRYNL